MVDMYRAKRLLARFIPDRLYVRMAFFKSHRWLPRTPPVTFNEHLCDLKSSGELARFQRFADKYAVRDHVARKIGARYLVPLHATAKRLTREVWDALPDAFVLKTNHGSSWNRIVRNKGMRIILRCRASPWLARQELLLRAPGTAVPEHQADIDGRSAADRTERQRHQGLQILLLPWESPVHSRHRQWRERKQRLL